MQKKNKHSSDMLMEILENGKYNDYLTVQDILQQLGDNVFGVVILLFALPSVLPVTAIPGISFLFSLPILFFALQMVIARKTLWLPNIIAMLKFNYKTIYKIIYISVPYIKRVEHILKPRLPFLTCGFMELINGIVIFCLSLLLTLPIPFSNIILAMLLIVFSLGLIEKDGVFIIFGYITTFLYFNFMFVLILTAIKAIFK